MLKAKLISVRCISVLLIGALLLDLSAPAAASPGVALQAPRFGWLFAAQAVNPYIVNTLKEVVPNAVAKTREVEHYKVARVQPRRALPPFLAKPFQFAWAHKFAIFNLAWGFFVTNLGFIHGATFQTTSSSEFQNNSIVVTQHVHAIVQNGDTLSKIAQQAHQYGSHASWMKLYYDNQKVIHSTIEKMGQHAVDKPWDKIWAKETFDIVEKTTVQPLSHPSLIDLHHIITPHTVSIPGWQSFLLNDGGIFLAAAGIATLTAAYLLRKPIKRAAAAVASKIREGGATSARAIHRQRNPILATLAFITTLVGAIVGGGFLAHYKNSVPDAPSVGPKPAEHVLAVKKPAQKPSNKAPSVWISVSPKPTSAPQIKNNTAPPAPPVTIVPKKTNNAVAPKVKKPVQKSPRATSPASLDPAPPPVLFTQPQQETPWIEKLVPPVPPAVVNQPKTEHKPLNPPARGANDTNDGGRASVGRPMDNHSSVVDRLPSIAVRTGPMDALAAKIKALFASLSSPVAPPRNAPNESFVVLPENAPKIRFLKAEARDDAPAADNGARHKTSTHPDEGSGTLPLATLFLLTTGGVALRLRRGHSVVVYHMELNSLSGEFTGQWVIKEETAFKNKSEGEQATSSTKDERTSNDHEVQMPSSQGGSNAAHIAASIAETKPTSETTPAAKPITRIPKSVPAASKMSPRNRAVYGRLPKRVQTRLRVEAMLSILQSRLAQSKKATKDKAPDNETIFELPTWIRGPRPVLNPFGTPNRKSDSFGTPDPEADWNPFRYEVPIRFPKNVNPLFDQPEEPAISVPIRDSVDDDEIAAAPVEDEALYETPSKSSPRWQPAMSLTRTQGHSAQAIGRAISDLQHLIGQRAELVAEFNALKNNPPADKTQIPPVVPLKRLFVSFRNQQLSKFSSLDQLFQRSRGIDDNSFEDRVTGNFRYTDAPPYFSDLVIQAWLTKELAQVLAIALAQGYPFDRKLLDGLFYQLYPPANGEQNLLTHPSEIGRLAIGSFFEDENDLVRVHERLIALFNEPDGANAYVYGFAADLGRHFRRLWIRRDTKVFVRHANGPDYVMGFEILKYLIHAYESYLPSGRNERSKQKLLVAFADLLSGDPDAFTNLKFFNTQTRAQALRAYDRFSPEKARELFLGRSRKEIADGYFIDHIDPSERATLFNRLENIKPSLKRDLEKLAPQLNSPPEYSSPLRRGDVFYEELLAKAFDYEMAHKRRFQLRELDSPHDNPKFYERTRFLGFDLNDPAPTWQALMRALGPSLPAPESSTDNAQILNPTVHSKKSESFIPPTLDHVQTTHSKSDGVSAHPPEARPAHEAAALKSDVVVHERAAQQIHSSNPGETIHSESNGVSGAAHQNHSPAPDVNPAAEGSAHSAASPDSEERKTGGSYSVPARRTDRTPPVHHTREAAVPPLSAATEERAAENTYTPKSDETIHSGPNGMSGVVQELGEAIISFMENLLPSDHEPAHPEPELGKTSHAVNLPSIIEPAPQITTIAGNQQKLDLGYIHHRGAARQNPSSAPEMKPTTEVSAHSAAASDSEEKKSGGSHSAPTHPTNFTTPVHQSREAAVPPSSVAAEDRGVENTHAPKPGETIHSGSDAVIAIKTSHAADHHGEHETIRSIRPNAVHESNNAGKTEGEVLPPITIVAPGSKHKDSDAAHSVAPKTTKPSAVVPEPEGTSGVIKGLGEFITSFVEDLLPSSHETVRTESAAGDTTHAANHPSAPELTPQITTIGGKQQKLDLNYTPRSTGHENHSSALQVKSAAEISVHPAVTPDSENKESDGLHSAPAHPTNLLPAVHHTRKAVVAPSDIAAEAGFAHQTHTPKPGKTIPTATEPAAVAESVHGDAVLHSHTVAEERVAKTTHSPKPSETIHPESEGALGAAHEKPTSAARDSEHKGSQGLHPITNAADHAESAHVETQPDHEIPTDRQIFEERLAHLNNGTGEREGSDASSAESPRRRLPSALRMLPSEEHSVSPSQRPTGSIFNLNAPAKSPASSAAAPNHSPRWWNILGIFSEDKPAPNTSTVETKKHYEAPVVSGQSVATANNEGESGGAGTNPELAHQLPNPDGSSRVASNHNPAPSTPPALQPRRHAGSILNLNTPVKSPESETAESNHSSGWWNPLHLFVTDDRASNTPTVEEKKNHAAPAVEKPAEKEGAAKTAERAHQPPILGAGELAQSKPGDSTSPATGEPHTIVSAAHTAASVDNDQTHQPGETSHHTTTVPSGLAAQRHTSSIFNLNAPAESPASPTAAPNHSRRWWNTLGIFSGDKPSPNTSTAETKKDHKDSVVEPAHQASNHDASTGIESNHNPSPSPAPAAEPQRRTDSIYHLNAPVKSQKSETTTSNHSDDRWNPLHLVVTDHAGSNTTTTEDKRDHGAPVAEKPAEKASTAKSKPSDSTSPVTAESHPTVSAPAEAVSLDIGSTHGDRHKHNTPTTTTAPQPQRQTGSIFNSNAPANPSPSNAPAPTRSATAGSENWWNTFHFVPPTPSVSNTPAANQKSDDKENIAGPAVAEGSAEPTAAVNDGPKTTTSNHSSDWWNPLHLFVPHNAGSNTTSVEEKKDNTAPALQKPANKEDASAIPSSPESKHAAPTHSNASGSSDEKEIRTGTALGEWTAAPSATHQPSETSRSVGTTPSASPTQPQAGSIHHQSSDTGHKATTAPSAAAADATTAENKSGHDHDGSTAKPAESKWWNIFNRSTSQTGGDSQPKSSTSFWKRIFGKKADESKFPNWSALASNPPGEHPPSDVSTPAVSDPASQIEPQVAPKSVESNDDENDSGIREGDLRTVFSDLVIPGISRRQLQKEQDEERRLEERRVSKRSRKDRAANNEGAQNEVRQTIKEGWESSQSEARYFKGRAAPQPRPQNYVDERDMATNDSRPVVEGPRRRAVENERIAKARRLEEFGRPTRSRQDRASQKRSGQSEIENEMLDGWRESQGPARYYRGPAVQRAPAPYVEEGDMRTEFEGPVVEGPRRRTVERERNAKAQRLEESGRPTRSRQKRAAQKRSANNSIRSGIAEGWDTPQGEARYFRDPAVRRAPVPYVEEGDMRTEFSGRVVEGRRRRKMQKGEREDDLEDEAMVRSALKSRDSRASKKHDHQLMVKKVMTHGWDVPATKASYYVGPAVRRAPVPYVEEGDMRTIHEGPIEEGPNRQIARREDEAIRAQPDYNRAAQKRDVQMDVRHTMIDGWNAPEGPARFAPAAAVRKAPIEREFLDRLAALRAKIVAATPETYLEYQSELQRRDKEAHGRLKKSVVASELVAEVYEAWNQRREFLRAEFVNRVAALKTKIISATEHSLPEDRKTLDALQLYARSYFIDAGTVHAALASAEKAYEEAATRIYHEQEADFTVRLQDLLWRVQNSGSTPLGDLRNEFKKAQEERGARFRDASHLNVILLEINRALMSARRRQDWEAGRAAHSRSRIVETPRSFSELHGALVLLNGFWDKMRDLLSQSATTENPSGDLYPSALIEQLDRFQRDLFSVQMVAQRMYSENPQVSPLLPQFIDELTELRKKSDGAIQFVLHRQRQESNLSLWNSAANPDEIIAPPAPRFWEFLDETVTKFQVNGQFDLPQTYDTDLWKIYFETWRQLAAERSAMAKNPLGIIQGLDDHRPVPESIQEHRAHIDVTLSGIEKSIGNFLEARLNEIENNSQTAHAGILLTILRQQFTTYFEIRNEAVARLGEAQGLSIDPKSRAQLLEAKREKRIFERLDLLKNKVSAGESTSVPARLDLAIADGWKESYRAELETALRILREDRLVAADSHQLERVTSAPEPSEYDAEHKTDGFVEKHAQDRYAIPREVTSPWTKLREDVCERLLQVRKEFFDDSSDSQLRMKTIEDWAELEARREQLGHLLQQPSPKPKGFFRRFNNWFKDQVDRETGWQIVDVEAAIPQNIQPLIEEAVVDIDSKLDGMEQALWVDLMQRIEIIEKNLKDLETAIDPEEIKMLYSQLDALDRAETRRAHRLVYSEPFPERIVDFDFAPAKSGRSNRLFGGKRKETLSHYLDWRIQDIERKMNRLPKTELHYELPQPTRQLRHLEAKTDIQTLRNKVRTMNKVRFGNTFDWELETLQRQLKETEEEQKALQKAMFNGSRRDFEHNPDLLAPYEEFTNEFKAFRRKLELHTTHFLKPRETVSGVATALIAAGITAPALVETGLATVEAARALKESTRELAQKAKPYVGKVIKSGPWLFIFLIMAVAIAHGAPPAIHIPGVNPIEWDLSSRYRLWMETKGAGYWFSIQAIIVTDIYLNLLAARALFQQRSQERATERQLKHPEWMALRTEGPAPIVADEKPAIKAFDSTAAFVLKEKETQRYRLDRNYRQYLDQLNKYAEELMRFSVKVHRDGLQAQDHQTLKELDARYEKLVMQRDLLPDETFALPTSVFHALRGGHKAAHTLVEKAQAPALNSDDVEVLYRDVAKDLEARLGSQDERTRNDAKAALAYARRIYNHHLALPRTLSKSDMQSLELDLDRGYDPDHWTFKEVSPFFDSFLHVLKQGTRRRVVGVADLRQAILFRATKLSFQPDPLLNPGSAPQRANHLVLERA